MPLDEQCDLIDVIAGQGTCRHARIGRVALRRSAGDRRVWGSSARIKGHWINSRVGTTRSVRGFASTKPCTLASCCRTIVARQSSRTESVIICANLCNYEIIGSDDHEPRPLTCCLPRVDPGIYQSFVFFDLNFDPVLLTQNRRHFYMVSWKNSLWTRTMH